MQQGVRAHLFVVYKIIVVGLSIMRGQWKLLDLETQDTVSLAVEGRS